MCSSVRIAKLTNDCPLAMHSRHSRRASAWRAGWNGKGLSVELQVPDENSKMTLPYIFMNYPATPASETAPANHINAKVPWLASQTDMLAKDWAIVE